ncbi:MAG: outer membrane protein [Xanthobacteraceae bacterium]|jgi:outer membrane immunogenic protein
MKRILIAGALALAAGGQALAADLPQPGPPPTPRAPSTYVPTTAPVYNWGGIYFGINGGYGFGTSNWTPAAPFIPTGNFSTSGFLAGGTLGANYQMGAFVLGIEGDGDWTNLSGSVTCTRGYTCQTSSDWLATARGRIGYAFDRILLYGTGGGAAGNIKAYNSASGGTDSNTEYGWTAGAGIEAALAQNWTVKVEYLYVDLANGACTTSCPGGFAPVAVSFTESLVRAGINYKFNF